MKMFYIVVPRLRYQSKAYQTLESAFEALRLAREGGMQGKVVMI